MRFDFESYHSAYESIRNFSARATTIYQKLPIFRPPDDRIIRNLSRGTNLLDVACGTGWYLSRIVSIRPDLGLWGFDFNGSDLFPKENAVFITGEVSANFSFPFEDNTFSFISCMDLIEHLNTESLLRLMTEIKRVLKPDGYLYIKAPNPRSLYLNFWDDPTHLRPFTATALKRLFGMYKLKVFKIWSGRGLFGYLAAPLLLVYAIIKRDRAIFAVFIDCLIGMWVGGICQKLD